MVSDGFQNIWGHTVFNFIVTFCNRGGLSTEVGSRAHRLHLLGVFQTLFPTTPNACKVLTVFVMSVIVDNGKGYRVVCKPLARGQSFIYNHVWLYI